MEVIKRYNSCINRLEELRIKAKSKQEFNGKDHNSMKSIFLQILQNGLLTDKQKITNMLNILTDIEENEK